MNNTKWNELFLAFYENDGKRGKSLAVFYRTKERNGYISAWSNEWELFGSQFPFWKDLEWLQIQLSGENRQFVLDALRRIHVPGEIQDNIVTVYGYRQDCAYL